MSLKLMYITNNTDVAKVAEAAGVDRIFVDLEYIGKSLRQGGMDTVQNRHTIDDIASIRKVLEKSELLVRVNPIHNATNEYMSSEDEISLSIEAGADIVMLPYFKTVSEVNRFIDAVNGKANTMLLFETAESIENIDEILAIHGIDEVYIGLNDLSLSYGNKFMFELLANGTVERIAKKFVELDYTFGFGGIAALSKGLLPAEYIIREHYRLGSSSVILSRSFCNTNLVTDINEIRSVFTEGVSAIREFELECMDSVIEADNMEQIKEKVNLILERMSNK